MSEIIRLEHIWKRFTGVTALSDVSVSFSSGEVHALVGENGAGKSTLIKVLLGAYQPTEGRIFYEGKETVIESPRKGSELGIEGVHQELMLVPYLSVSQNIFLNREIRKGKIFDVKEMNRRSQELLHDFSIDIDVTKPVKQYSASIWKMIDIARVINQNPKVIIFDEPTAVLTPQEIEELMQIMRGFKEEGKSILFITHKLNEIMAVADRCTVLQKGRGIGTVEIAKTSKEELSRMMVGRDVEFAVEKAPCEPGRTILEVNDLVVASKVHKNNAVKGVSFQVRAGEIVCVAGIEGNGQSELVYGLTGLEKVSSGSIKLNGKDITAAPIRDRSKDGMSHIPEDRHKHGLVLDYTLADNLVLQRYWQPQFQNHGFIKKGEVLTYAERLIEQYDVRSGQGAQTIARSMSGGNQQKAIIAREVDKDPDLLVAVQPTRGLDVGAIEYIHKQIVAERDKGKAVLLISLELDEVMNLSDRILVMYEGEIVGEFDPHKTTVEELGLYMAGAKKQGEAKA